jgi:hypothetical protein
MKRHDFLADTVPFLRPSAEGRALLDSRNNDQTDFRLADLMEDIVTARLMPTRAGESLTALRNLASTTAINAPASPGTRCSRHYSFS